MIFAMSYKTLKNTALIGLSAFGLSAIAAEEKELETLWIHGSIENIETLSGSAQSIDADTLEQLNTADIHEVVTQVPGVYVREEDGFGLRPNIGIRGAASERSQNITLMEDGILIKPSPYSAPAAYYFPNIARIQRIDVFKGPSAVKYGPRTVGGAINLITRQPEATRNGFVEASYGSFNTRKLHAVYGDKLGSENISYLIDALHLGSDGFKDLDTGGDTGFTRNDINLRIGWTPQASSGTTQHRFDLKIGFADEDSDETYLGLSDADFAADPTRRYVGSQLDRFTSEHKQIHLFHLAEFDNGLELHTKVYLNTFDRSWNRVDGLFDINNDREDNNFDITSILLAPTTGVNREFFSLLDGSGNSSTLPTQSGFGIDITNNQRDYRSYGVDVSARKTIELADWQHDLEAGIRLHEDYVERNHTGRGHAVENQQLIAVGTPFQKVINKDESRALALYLKDSITQGPWRYDLGLRFVDIQSERSDRLDPTSNATNDESAVLAAAGVFYQYTESLGFLAGIHRGYSPAGPGPQGGTADPEESVNIEYGVRYNSPVFSGEAIAFFSDYSNLIGRCRANDISCNQGESFNGGSVHVSGLELRGSYEKELNSELTLPISFNYTLTQSEFQESFDSSFNQWGSVSKGDELPYTPEHTLRLDIGIQAYSWDTSIAVKYRSDLRETATTAPSQIAPLANQTIDSLTTVDWTSNYHVNDNLSIQAKVQNLTDEVKIVSRRPIGARPNKPRSFIASAKYRF